MEKNPLNLLLRFLLELSALFSMGFWGYSQHEGLLRWILALGVPILAAAIWGIFRVPNDPGKPPIRVPGIVRLGIEVAFFGAAVMLLMAARERDIAALFGVLVLGHYAISWRRVIWLLTQ